MTIKIKSIEDAVNHLFSNKYGWIWEARLQNRYLEFRVVRGNTSLLGEWSYWGETSLEVLNKHIYDGVNTGNPVFDKIKQMEQRFKDRHATTNEKVYSI